MSILSSLVEIHVRACKGDPINSTVLGIVFYFLFNLFEAMIEELLFGERFLNWLDPIFLLLFTIYIGICIWRCQYYSDDI